jgi:hypothetical protein
MANQATFTGPTAGTELLSDASNFLYNMLPNSMRGRVWDCMIAGLATGEQRAWDNAPLVRDQMFLSTASDVWLDRRMAGFGLERPVGIGMTDTVARQYAIQVVNHQETIPAILETLEVFYGVDAVHAHLVASLDQPYALSNGMTLVVTVDGLTTVTVSFLTADFLSIAQASAQEVAAVLNREFMLRSVNAYALVSTNPNTGAGRITLYSGTYGGRSTLQVAAGSAATALGLSTLVTRLLSQPRAAYVLTRGPGAVEVFLPSTTVVVARDSTDAAYLTINNATAGVGPYLYEGVNKGLGITSTVTTTTGALLAGHSYRVVPVASAASFPDAAGWVVFGYGYSYQVGPVPYLGRSGTASLVLDPTYTLTSDIPIGAKVNLLTSNKPLVPTLGESGDFWLTDSPSGRVAAGAATTDITAAGYQVTKTVTYPGDVGLGNAGHATHGTQAISDIVECFAGSDVDAETAAARSS